MLNVGLLAAEAVVYFSLMATLFRLRARIGIGVFMCALGVMHFLETYLAAVFYVPLPFGIVSPGSTVLFSGKLVMLLMLYIKEDARIVRQPIYGLLLGNALMIALVLLMRMHTLADLPGGQSADMGFLDQMGWLMVWGTTLLYVDAILIILLYEKLGHWLRAHMCLRIALAAAAILTFDQIGFFTALHFVADAPASALIGGWAAKMGAALLFSIMLVTYLRRFERQPSVLPRVLSDVFETLTYREKYEALVESAGHDDLTGLLNRGRFERLGEKALANARASGKPLCLLVFDIDYFKSINDRFGHAEGDRVLRSIAGILKRSVEGKDMVFRIGGEEFAILCPYPLPVARLLGESIRIAAHAEGVAAGYQVTVSSGVAAAGPDTPHLSDLFGIADRRLYMAKAAGRDRIVSDDAPAAASHGQAAG